MSLVSYEADCDEHFCVAFNMVRGVPWVLCRCQSGFLTDRVQRPAAFGELISENEAGMFFFELAELSEQRHKRIALHNF